MAHLYVSAAHKSSGKTTITIGLCGALTRRGLAVQPFKKGPDYIDPMWLTMATGTACRNLDFFTMARDEIADVFTRHAAEADIAIAEGNKGLHDGLDVDGADSNAAMAKLLGAPVLLVVDTQGMTRGIAPLVRGFADFDPEIVIAGVILNKVGNARHEAKLRRAVEHYTDIPVLGAVYRNPEMEIVERHLGLVPSNEAAQARAKIDAISRLVGEQTDLDRIVAVARTATAPATPRTVTARSGTRDIRIGIARDPAFGFYYPEDLEAMDAAGAEVVPIDMIHSTHLPEVDGLFIGGGFPETQMMFLERNITLREDVRAAIENGLPVYAECGGLMYLARRITWKGSTSEMVGVIPGDIVVNPRPVGHGHVRLRETDRHPWPYDNDAEIVGHEFHYSTFENLDDRGLSFAYDVVRGVGSDGRRDGIIHKNLLANYAHLRSVGGNDWARRFVDFARACKTGHRR